MFLLALKEPFISTSGTSYLRVSHRHVSTVARDRRTKHELLRAFRSRSSIRFQDSYDKRSRTAFPKWVCGGIFNVVTICKHFARCHWILHAVGVRCWQPYTWPVFTLSTSLSVLLGLKGPEGKTIGGRWVRLCLDGALDCLYFTLCVWHFPLAGRWLDSTPEIHLDKQNESTVSHFVGKLWLSSIYLNPVTVTLPSRMTVWECLDMSTHTHKPPIKPVVFT